MPLIEYFLKEFSEQAGLPVLLYQFEMQAGEFSSSDNIFWRFCNLSRDFFWQGETWYASAIKNSKIQQSSEMNRDGINLTFPRTDVFARQFVGLVPEFLTLVTIHRGHLTQPDDQYAVYWRGRVGAGKADGNSIILACESIFTSLRRFGLRARYTRTCRHVLYRGGCRLDRADFASTGTVSSATNSTVTSTVFGTQFDGFWIGGILEAPDGALRFIVNHSGNVVTLWRAIQSIIDDLALMNPVTILVYPGCNKSIEHCRDKFNNLPNFGGFPLLPERNPFDGRSIL